MSADLWGTLRLPGENVKMSKSFQSPTVERWSCSRDRVELSVAIDCQPLFLLYVYGLSLRPRVLVHIVPFAHLYLQLSTYDGFKVDWLYGHVWYKARACAYEGSCRLQRVLEMGTETQYSNIMGIVLGTATVSWHPISCRNDSIHPCIFCRSNSALSSTTAPILVILLRWCVFYLDKCRIGILIGPWVESH